MVEEPDGIVGGHLPRVVEGADPVEVEAPGQQPVPAGGHGRQHGELAIEGREEGRGEEGVARRQGGNPGQVQLGHQPVLERPQCHLAPSSEGTESLSKDKNICRDLTGTDARGIRSRMGRLADSSTSVMKEGAMVRALVVAALVFALIPMSSALADMSRDSGPGCGLGKIAWAGVRGQNKIVQQVLAATTNGTLGNQTFGITSGTSGCTNDGLVMDHQKVSVFASVNFENLKQDMAQGRGERLTSLAWLMGIPAEQQGAFFALTQEKHGVLFQSETTTSTEMLIALNRELSAHPVLAQAVIR